MIPGRQSSSPATFEEQFCEGAWKQIADKGLLTHTAGLEEAMRIAGEGHRLLDVGCGRGEFAALVREKFAEIHGTDISPTALSLAAKEGVLTVKVNLNVEALPYENGFFDVVACLDFIEHVYEPGVLLREMSRVLRPSGRFIIQTFNIRYYKFVWSIVRGHFPETVGGAVHNIELDSYNFGHYSNFTFADLTRLAEKHGLHVTEKIGTGRPRPKTVLAKFLNLVLPGGFKREFLSPGLMLGGKKE